MRLEAFQLRVDFALATQKVDRPISASQIVDAKLLDEVLREGSGPGSGSELRPEIFDRWNVLETVRAFR